MKSIFLILAITIATLTGVSTQNIDKHTSIMLTDSYGDTSNLDLAQATGPMLFVIYGPGCGICLKELKAIAIKIKSWEQLYNVKLIAFSRKYRKDYSRQISKSKEKTELNFPLYIDVNGDIADYLYDAPGIDTSYFSHINGLHLKIPQTIILSKDKKVLFQKYGYQIGDEEKIEAILKKP
ncbi:MAG: redoxin domain-containing protein [Bacteroidales bacterium]|nr:redoxin domain-containing protein [Bacteroidales bacterium]